MSFDVDFLSSSPGDEQDYVWLLKVSAEVPEKYGHEYRSITLERHKEKAPLGERQYYEFDFTTPEALRQLTIRFSLNYPGTSATFKNVVLRCPGEEKKLNFSFQRFLPRPVYERFAGFRTALTEEPRVLHYRDAWKIIQDYSLFGAGGGAWESLYLGYTEKVFYTTEPHSHFLKIWLEAGLFAFLAFIGIWLSVLYSYRRIRSAQQEMPEEQVVATALYVAIFTLGLHAAVDFSFSLGSVSLLFFTLLGAGRSLIYEEEKVSKHVKKRPRNLKLQFTLVLGLLISILLLLYSFSLWLGFRAGTAAAVALEKREYREAEMLLHRAMRWDLLQAANYSTLAGLYQYRAESSPDRNEATWLMNEALKYGYQAWRREPYNITYNRQHGLLLLNFGEVEEGLNYLERTIDLDPYDPAHYVQTAASTLAATEYYLKAGQKQKAIVLLKRLIEMEARMERYHESAKRLNFYLGKAYFLLDDRPNAVNYWSDVDEDDQNYSASRQCLHKLKEHPDS